MPEAPKSEAIPASNAGSPRPWRWGGRRVEVHDESMRPTLLPGDRLRVDVRAYRQQPPHAGDIVVLRDPEEPRRWIVKRVAAVGPGTWWRTTRGLVAVRPDSPTTERPADAVELIPLRPSDVWVLGDDPDRSRDSRRFGPVPPLAVIGRAVRIYAPTARRRDL
ncbi:MAG: signal peptidase I [Thermoplasmata archaeon]|nr:signal peptidase I [Thermoplasmata archaeon]